MLRTALRFVMITLMVAAGAAASSHAQTTTVNWFNNGSTLLLNINGVALSQNAAGTNTDGMLVQLGYFSGSSTSANFTGTWTPLTGASSTSPTTVGDSPRLGGAGDGVIAFNTFFTTGSSAVNVYDSAFGDTGAYTTQSSVTIGASTPANGQVLAIRFYDTHDGTTGFYNTVSADNWLWQTPTNAGPVITMNLATSPLEFQDAANPFRTSIPVAAIPEPSAAVLAGIGIGTIAISRLVRRRYGRGR